MTFFVGNAGNIRLRRNSGEITGEVLPADVVTSLNRVGFDGSTDNLLTGDRIRLSTDDPRGLLFFPKNTWIDNTADIYHPSISAFVNINAAGGLRFFRSFAQAVNNVRAYELPVQAFSGDPLPISIQVSDVSENVLGNVSGFRFSTDRDAIDTTTLDDRFKRMYNAGLISGSGSIDCFFDYKTTGVKETSLLLIQLIHRVEIGSGIDLLLNLTDPSNKPSATNVYYEFSAVITKSAIEVNADKLITAAVDFVTTGEIHLLVGTPPGYRLNEDGNTITLNQSINYLLTEVED